MAGGGRTVAERAAAGKELRKRVPRSSQAVWEPPRQRIGPVDLIEAQGRHRVPWLVPVRHARMSVSPFTYFRGAALPMAQDLSFTPACGLRAQICGDAHLLNFGIYASPERELLFDVNDFDETHVGPWEWDVKRLAASFAVSAAESGFDAAQTDKVTQAVARAYREATHEFAGMRYMDVWYTSLRVEDYLPRLQGAIKKTATRTVGKARKRTNLQALEKLTEIQDGRRRFRADPPVLIPLRDLGDHLEVRTADEAVRDIEASFESYQSSLEDGRAALLRRFVSVDFALKVVGVGSVGTRCYVLYLEGRDAGDPLFIQVKEAQRSVLEEYLPAGRFRHQGRRVVEGQRLMQAASDIFLGWTTGPTGLHFYCRQLRDMKGSIDTGVHDPARLALYAELCGVALARAHARSGDSVATAAYLGSGETFDKAIAEFSAAYREQNTSDYAEFMDAIASGRLACEQPVT
ncbi:MAG: DUF2252 domain-containing protein [Acidimicrobiia bacterium]|nr:DUF2252 domain-containing protein [Acidimicrobiia bacterium]